MFTLASTGNPMLRIVIASMLLVGAGSIAGMPATSVTGKALAPPPQSRAEAALAIDDATAAALIGAISSQFGERAVQVRLGQVQATSAGIVQRDLHGTGQLQLGRDPVWIPFRFRALYDTEQASVGSPTLTLGDGTPSHALARKDALTRALAREVGRRLHREFAQQATDLRLKGVRSAPAGSGYLRLEANGVALFGGDGRAPTRIRALYDPRNGDWLQLIYDLGPAGTDSADAVAVR